jgi:hypothetical protein
MGATFLLWSMDTSHLFPNWYPRFLWIAWLSTTVDNSVRSTDSSSRKATARGLRQETCGARTEAKRPSSERSTPPPQKRDKPARVGMDSITTTKIGDHPDAASHGKHRGGRIAVLRRWQEEEARRQELHRQADRWTLSRRIRRYLRAREDAAAKLGRVSDSKFQRWLEWASQYADVLDPLAGSLPSDTPLRVGISRYEAAPWRQHTEGSE